MERSIVLYTITSMCCKLPSLVVPTCKMLNLDDIYYDAVLVVSWFFMVFG